MDNEALAARLREIADRLDSWSMTVNIKALGDMSEELESIASQVEES